MLPIQETSLEGKQVYFGDIQEPFAMLGYRLGGGWDYDGGCFDTILWREQGESVYLRLPFQVTEGTLDEYNTTIVFKTPYVIKHVVNIGLDEDASSLLTASFNQFQQPIDPDGSLPRKDYWKARAEEEIRKILEIFPAYQ